MTTAEKTSITISATVNVSVERAWTLWNDPNHIVKWNHASDDWHSPSAENDVRVGGKLKARMEAKDGSMGFDFEGTYTRIEPLKVIEYVLGDGRKVSINFESRGASTHITETFDAEQTHPVDMQRDGWQAILNNYKKYAEAFGKLIKLHFQIDINTQASRVYDTMLNHETYRAWTAEFNPTSKAEGTWAKGSTMRFIGVDEQGHEGGILSRILENIPNQYVSIEHYGLIGKGKEITTGADVEMWAGAQENYTFRESDGKTLLIIDTDTTPEYQDYFEAKWPKALNKLKQLCEA